MIEKNQNNHFSELFVILSRSYFQCKSTINRIFVFNHNKWWAHTNTPHTQKAMYLSDEKLNLALVVRPVRWIVIRDFVVVVALIAMLLFTYNWPRHTSDLTAPSKQNIFLFPVDNLMKNAAEIVIAMQCNERKLISMLNHYN